MSFSNSIIISLVTFSLLSYSHASSQSTDSIKKENASSKSNNTSTEKLKNDDIEEKIVDTIFRLKEVRERTKNIEEQTKGQRSLRIWFEDTPKLPGKKYYWVKVGEDNGAALVTHFNFYVYPDSMRIMYYDITIDKLLTLAKWRQVNNKSR